MRLQRAEVQRTSVITGASTATFCIWYKYTAQSLSECPTTCFRNPPRIPFKPVSIIVLHPISDYLHLQNGAWQHCSHTRGWPWRAIEKPTRLPQKWLVIDGPNVNAVQQWNVYYTLIWMKIFGELIPWMSNIVFLSNALSHSFDVQSRLYMYLSFVSLICYSSKMQQETIFLLTVMPDFGHNILHRTFLDPQIFSTFIPLSQHITIKTISQAYQSSERTTL